MYVFLSKINSAAALSINAQTLQIRQFAHRSKNNFHLIFTQIIVRNIQI